MHHSSQLESTCILPGCCRHYRLRNGRYATGFCFKESEEKTSRLFFCWERENLCLLPCKIGTTQVWLFLHCHKTVCRLSQRRIISTLRPSSFVITGVSVSALRFCWFSVRKSQFGDCMSGWWPLLPLWVPAQDFWNPSFLSFLQVTTVDVPNGSKSLSLVFILLCSWHKGFAEWRPPMRTALSPSSFVFSHSIQNL